MSAAAGIAQRTAAIAATLANPAMSGLFVIERPSIEPMTIWCAAGLSPRLPGATDNERIMSRLPTRVREKILPTNETNETTGVAIQVLLGVQAWR